MKATEIKSEENSAQAVKQRFAVFIHLLILMLVIGVIDYVYKESGMEIFLYYTDDSCLFAGIASGLYLLFGLMAISKGRSRGIISNHMVKSYKGDIPAFVRYLRYTASCALMLTFLVGLFIPGPEKGYHHEFLEGARFFSHFVIPALSLFSLFCLETGERLHAKAWLLPLLITLIYVVVLIVMNVLGLTEGPYSFLMVKKNGPVRSGAVLVGMMAFMWGLSFLMLKLCNLLSMKKREKENAGS